MLGILGEKGGCGMEGNEVWYDKGRVEEWRIGWLVFSSKAGRCGCSWKFCTFESSLERVFSE